METILSVLVVFLTIVLSGCIVNLLRRNDEIKNVGKLVNAGYTAHCHMSPFHSGHFWLFTKDGNRYSMEDALKREEMIRLNVIEVGKK